uniref:Transposable element protein n=1 Tax=Mesocestoides corti TaxID=53468 RepID=A0A5K3FJU8_MESCO
MDDESFLQVYKSKVPRQLFAWATILQDVGCEECQTGYFANTGYQQQKATWPRLILCLSAFQWHVRKISSQPEKDMTEVLYIMGDMASVVDSDGMRLTCDSGL